MMVFYSKSCCENFIY